MNKKPKKIKPQRTSSKSKYYITQPPQILSFFIIIISTIIFMARCEVLEKNHIHNRVIHFPIAFSIGAGIFEIISFFQPSFSKSSHIMIGLSALSSFASYLTGQKASENIQEKHDFESKKKVLEIHESLGFTLFILNSITFFIKFIQKLRVLSSILVFVCAIISAFSGYTGGILSHG